jgi:uncharacterized Zn-binding protein involved in type VI secretion
VGAPAIVMGDRITGQCPIHLIPNPATGAPQPAPPMPFSAPITMGTVATVLIGGKPAAVAGSQGLNTPPHVGLHPADPFLVPATQIGTVVGGSPTVLIGGQPAATQQSSCTCCATPASAVVPSLLTVLIG